ncbi:hypothetical protein LINPERHAP1_LOCUS24086, partial [Linum perenne]
PTVFSLSRVSPTIPFQFDLERDCLFTTVPHLLFLSLPSLSLTLSLSPPNRSPRSALLRSHCHLTFRLPKTKLGDASTTRVFILLLFSHLLNFSIKVWFNDASPGGGTVDVRLLSQLNRIGKQWREGRDRP